MKKSLLWVTDPWHTLDHPFDTTLRLIEESVQKGVPTFWCDFKTISIINGVVTADIHKVLAVTPARGSKDFHLGKAEKISPAKFARILYRVDPPVDLRYLNPLQMLCLAAKQNPSCEIISPPELLCCSSEKLEGFFIPGLSPSSATSSNIETLERFGTALGTTVLKPLYQAQSKGIELLCWNTPKAKRHARQAIEFATNGGTEPVMLQKFLEGINNGELRLWFLNGKLLSWGRKIPKKGEFKIDMDRGGKITSAELTKKDKEAVVKIGKHLHKRRIRLAAVDLIDGMITDFNYTSPGLLVELEKIHNVNLAKQVVKSLLSSR